MKDKLDGMVDNGDTKSQSFRHRYKLYAMHCCFTFISQTWSSCITFFLAALTNNSIFIVSFTGFVSALATLLLSPRIGQWADRNDRLKVVQIAIGVKIVGITGAYILCSILLSSAAATDEDVVKDPNQTQKSYPAVVYLIPLFVSLTQVAYNTLTICIEKDWIVVLSGNSTQWLTQTNSIMTIIDLSSSSLAPFFAGILFSELNLSILSCILLATNLVCSICLVMFLREIYYSWPLLHIRKKEEEIVLLETSKRSISTCDTLFLKKMWFEFSRSGCLLVMISFSCLFLTVLSFGSIMTVYLISLNINLKTVGVFRGVSALMGFLGAIIYRSYKEYVGLPLLGAIAIWEQAVFVGIAMLSFFLLSPPNSAYILCSGVLVSRIGLWAFDLCARQIAQETIKEDVRNQVNGMWNSITSFFDLLAYVLSMILSDSFWLLSLISFLSTILAAISFTCYYVNSKTVKKSKRSDHVRLHVYTPLMGTSVQFTKAVADADTVANEDNIDDLVTIDTDRDSNGGNTNSNNGNSYEFSINGGGGDEEEEEVVL